MYVATTSCKNVETLSRKNNLSCFKSLLVTGLWDKILTSLLPPFKVVPPSFEHGLVKGWRGGHKHKIMDRPFKPKYGTVSQVLLQLVVACNRKVQKLFLHNFTRAHPEVYVLKVKFNFWMNPDPFWCTFVQTFLKTLRKRNVVFARVKLLTAKWRHFHHFCLYVWGAENSASINELKVSSQSNPR